MALDLILYSKPGCHLCEGLLEKLQAIETPALQVEVRDITTQPQWFAAYEYEIPVLVWRSPQGEKTLPRLSPRAPVAQLAALLASLTSSGDSP